MCRRKEEEMAHKEMYPEERQPVDGGEPKREEDCDCAAEVNGGDEPLAMDLAPSLAGLLEDE